MEPFFKEGETIKILVDLLPVPSGFKKKWLSMIIRVQKIQLLKSQRRSRRTFHLKKKMMAGLF